MVNYNNSGITPGRLSIMSIKNNVSTSMFDGGDGVLGVIGSIPPPPNTAS